MRKTSIVASLENMIASIENREMTPGHINYIGYVIGMTVDLDMVDGSNDTGVTFLPNELRLIDNTCMRLMGGTTIALEDTARIKEVAGMILDWRRCVAKGGIVHRHVVSNADNIDRIVRLSAFVSPEIIASMSDLEIRDEAFFSAVQEIAMNEYEAIKAGKTLSEMELVAPTDAVDDSMGVV